jgi:hypothetical protein
MALSSIVRSQGHPKVLRSGPSSLGAGDRLARGLGWLGLGLGLAQLMAPHRFTRALGMDVAGSLVQAFGAREIASGILTLSVDKKLGLWSRVAGDVLDVAVLIHALDRNNPKRDNAKLALATVAGVTILDIIALQSVSTRHKRSRGSVRNYGDRTGFPSGLESAKGNARRMASGQSRNGSGDFERTVFGEENGAGRHRARRGS